ncbi:MAG: hypothetical protein SGBAC_010339 [Bacillariaceae sp.]
MVVAVALAHIAVFEMDEVVANDLIGDDAADETVDEIEGEIAADDGEAETADENADADGEQKLVGGDEVGDEVGDGVAVAEVDTEALLKMAVDSHTKDCVLDLDWLPLAYSGTMKPCLETASYILLLGIATQEAFAWTLPCNNPRSSGCCNTQLWSSTNHNPSPLDDDDKNYDDDEDISSLLSMDFKDIFSDIEEDSGSIIDNPGSLQRLIRGSDNTLWGSDIKASPNDNNRLDADTIAKLQEITEQEEAKKYNYGNDNVDEFHKIRDAELEEILEGTGGDNNEDLSYFLDEDDYMRASNAINADGSLPEYMFETYDNNYKQDTRPKQNDEPTMRDFLQALKQRNATPKKNSNLHAKEIRDAVFSQEQDFVSQYMDTEQASSTPQPEERNEVDDLSSMGSLLGTFQQAQAIPEADVDPSAADVGDQVFNEEEEEEEEGPSISKYLEMEVASGQHDRTPKEDGNLQAKDIGDQMSSQEEAQIDVDYEQTSRPQAEEEDEEEEDDDDETTVQKLVDALKEKDLIPPEDENLQAKEIRDQVFSKEAAFSSQYVESEEYKLYEEVLTRGLIDNQDEDSGGGEGEDEVDLALKGLQETIDAKNRGNGEIIPQQQQQQQTTTTTTTTTEEDTTTIIDAEFIGDEEESS